MKVTEGTVFTTLEIKDYTHRFHFVRSVHEDGSIVYLSWIYKGVLLLADSCEDISKEVFENIKYFFNRCTDVEEHNREDGAYMTYTIKSSGMA